MINEAEDLVDSETSTNKDLDRMMENIIDTAIESAKAANVAAAAEGGTGSGAGAVRRRSSGCSAGAAGC